MFEPRWLSPRFWRWWWQYRASVGMRSLVVGSAVALVLGGGFASASTISAHQSPVVTVLTTVRVGVAAARADAQPRTRVVRKLVPVYVTRKDRVTSVVTVPVVKSVVVTETRPATTVVRTQLVPVTTAKTLTHVVRRDRIRTAVVTTQQTVTSQQTVTMQDTVSNVSTVTVSQVATATVVRTTTQPVTDTLTRTTTAPPVTVTVLRTTTQPVTATVVHTTTQPFTTTVTTPTTITATTTVTVTTPASPPPPKGKK